MKKQLKITLIIAAALILAVTAFLLVWFLYAVPKREERDLRNLVEEYRAAKLARYAEENAALVPGENYVLFLGDSLTDGCTLERYYPEYKTLNRGIGGDKTSDLVGRLKVSAYDAHPAAVVLLIGGNNLSTMFDDYEEILKGLQGTLPKAKVVVVSLTAMGGRFAEKNALVCLNNVKIKLLAEKYGFLYVDVFTPLFDPEINEIKPEYTSDGAHLTDAGYNVLTAQVKKGLAALLGKTE